MSIFNLNVFKKELINSKLHNLGIDTSKKHVLNIYIKKKKSTVLKLKYL